MLTILTTTDHKAEVAEAIAMVDRLDELVDITEDPSTLPLETKFLVVNTTIKPTLDWHDSEPPYVLPEVDFTSANLLAYIFLSLGNHERAFDYLEDDSELYHHFLTVTHLRYNYEISDEMLAFAKKSSKHNLAILQHYGILKNPSDFKTLKGLYEDALENSENDEQKIFTAKHYLNLLMDARLSQEAEKLVHNLRGIAISSEAQNVMDVQHAAIAMAQLRMPYDPDELDEMLGLQQKIIRYYETRNLKVQAGLLLIDAAEVANYQEDYILSKELINKAIQYFKQEGIPEFLGEAGLKKAILLYTWSKNGSPQYYKAAIAAFQDTLKVFKKDIHPEKFAQVQHNLALIYSEMPSSPEEKGIWSAFSASSFKNALEIYDKENYPYEFAMASHNYATALMDFPPAKVHDNLAKAQGLFEDALKIRTPSQYPMERSLTLLNQLELYWLTHNEDSDAETKKYRAMLWKIDEIKKLTTDENLLKQADNHRERLEKLKELLPNN